MAQNQTKWYLMLALILLSRIGLATSYTWNGSSSSDWATAGNWTPNGVPGPADNVTINGSGIQPLLDTIRTITNFTISGSSTTLDLNTYQLSITGTSTFTSGTINNGAVNCTGSTTYFNGTRFNASVTVNSATITLANSKFYNEVSLTKTGSSNDIGTGGCRFHDTTLITVSGTGYMRTGYTNPDTFDVVTFSSTGSGPLEIGYIAQNNIFNGTTTFSNSGTSLVSCASYTGTATFNGNIIVNSTSGTGVTIIRSTLGSGKTISIGSSGFSAGTLRLGLTQVGNTAQSFSLTGNANLSFYNSVFNGHLTCSSPGLTWSRNQFNGKINFTKTGNNNEVCPGGASFNDTSSITLTGSGYLRTGYNSPDTFDVVTFSNSGSAALEVAYLVAGNIFNGTTTFNNSSTSLISCAGYTGSATFNGDIVVNATSGTGIVIIRSTLSSGKTVSIGNTGFSSGTLRLGLSQTGTAAQNLTLTGSATAYLHASTFNGPVTVSAPALVLGGSTFNSTFTGTKTGSTNDQWSGGNVFNSSNTVTNSGTGYLLMGSNSLADTFNGPVTYVKNGSGQVYISYSNETSYSDDITINSTTGLSAGKITFTGSNTPSLNKTVGTPDLVVNQMKVNKSAGAVTVNMNPAITSNLTLINGILSTGSHNGTSSHIVMYAGTTITGGSDSSFVSGKLKKIGNSAFTFPLGAAINGTNYYHPISITAPSLTTDAFTAEYIPSAQPFGATMATAIESISDQEYWTLSRDAGSSSVKVTLGWNSNSNINNIGNLSIAEWNGSQWTDLGTDPLTLTWPTGLVTSLTTPALSVSPKPIAYVYLKDTRPYVVLKKTLDAGYYVPARHQLKFKFEDEYNDTNHSLSYKIYNSTHTNIQPTLVSTANNNPVSTYGDNRFSLDLYTATTGLPAGFYILEVSNEKQEKWYLRFKKQ